MAEKNNKQLIDEALAAIQQIIDSRREMFDDKSDAWQQGDKGQEWDSVTGELEDIHSDLDAWKDENL